MCTEGILKQLSHTDDSQHNKSVVSPLVFLLLQLVKFPAVSVRRARQ
jgi:hypothetical protein